MVIPYGFKSRLSHQEDSFIGILFLLRRSTHFEPSSAAPPCKNKEHIYAGMAELADALDSGSNGRKAVQVQVLLPAPIAESLEIVDNQRFRGLFFLHFILGKFREKGLKSPKNIKNASQMQVKITLNFDVKTSCNIPIAITQELKFLEILTNYHELKYRI